MNLFRYLKSFMKNMISLNLKIIFNIQNHFIKLYHDISCNIFYLHDLHIMKLC